MRECQCHECTIAIDNDVVEVDTDLHLTILPSSAYLSYSSKNPQAPASCRHPPSLMCAHQDSNLGPFECESNALTS